MREPLRAGLAASPRYLGALFIALMLAFVLGCSQDRAKAVTAMNKGIEAFQSGQTMTAVENLKEAHQTDPTFAEPALYLGQLYHRELSELDNAEQYYREALQRKPESTKIPYKLGTVLADKGDHSEAAQYFRQTVDRDPNHAKAWFRLGLAQLAQGQQPEAVDSFMKSIRINPRMKMTEEDPGGAAYHALGDLYIRYGFYDKALQVYQNGITNNEGVARLYGGRGIAQLKLDRLEEAAESFEKALQLDPQHLSATFNLAAVRNDLGDYDGAIEVLEAYQGRAEDSVRASAAGELLRKLRTRKENQE